ncbi:hypothetical protein LPLM1_00111 [Listeria phage LPML1]|nr:hypothetical protein LPLM1_00111 [Listeria phage LPML1]
MRRFINWFKEDLLLRVVFTLVCLGAIAIIYVIMDDTFKVARYVEENQCMTTGRTNSFIIPMTIFTGDTTMIVPQLVIEREWYCAKTNETFWR